MEKFGQVTQYVYVFVRQDLSFPQQVVQSSHASIEASKFLSQEQHPHIVLIGVSDEEALIQVICRLESANIKFAAFQEPDRNNEYTAIATAPISGDGRKFFKKYQCLKSKACEQVAGGIF